jgi:flagellar hook-associated protein 2
MSISGVGVIDVQTIVDNLMKVEEIRRKDPLVNSRDTKQTQLTAFGTLKTYLSGFQNQLEQLSTAFKMPAYDITSSDTKIATVKTYGSIIAPGIHALNITQLAQNDIYQSTAFSSRTDARHFSSPLTITMGTQSFTVTPSATDSLDKIRDRINTATNNPGVTASIFASVDIGGNPQYQLVVAGNKTGADNAISISGAGAADFNFSHTTTAQDAVFDFDGVADIHRASNNVSDVYDGISMSFVTTGSVTLNVTENSEGRNTAITTGIQNVLQAYNKVIGYIDANQADSSAKSETFGMIKMQLQNKMGTFFNESGNDLHYLSDIGIKLDKPTTLPAPPNAEGKVINYVTSTLSLDTDKLNSILTTNFNGLQNFLLADSVGVFTNVKSELDGKILLNDDDGVVYYQTHNITDDISDLDKKISVEDDRLNQMRVDLTKKYADLNALLSKYQQTSSFLTQQFASLSSSLSIK